MEKLATGAARLGLPLSPGQLRLFEEHYRLLLAWNQRLNLTTITDYEEVQVKHFLDSLTVVPALPPGVQRVADVGTGAGFPGLPVKIARPELEVVLVESAAKKTAFLRHLIAALGLSRVEIVTARAEEVGHRPGYREAFDAVLSRALAPLAVVAEICLPLARLGGSVIAQKSAAQQGEAAAAAKAIALLGGKLREVHPVALEELPGRVLVVLEKVAPTPPQYPRRPGIPEKRPLKSG